MHIGSSSSFAGVKKEKRDRSRKVFFIFLFLFFLKNVSILLCGGPERCMLKVSPVKDDIPLTFTCSLLLFSSIPLPPLSIRPSFPISLSLSLSPLPSLPLSPSPVLVGTSGCLRS